MDKAKLEKLIELHLEGKGSKQICQTINQSHGIVDWTLLFIKVHGIKEMRLYNDGIGRPSYSRQQILGIHNFVLQSNCGYERAEIYFKIKRNKLLAKIKRYIGKENIDKIAEDAVPIYPKVDRNCDSFIASLPKGLLGDENKQLEPSITDLAEKYLCNAPSANGYVDSLSKIDTANNEPDIQVNLDSMESYATFSQDVSKEVEPTELAPRIFGRASASVKYYKPTRKPRSKYIEEQRRLQMEAVMACAPLYLNNMVFNLWSTSIKAGFKLTKLHLSLFYTLFLQHIQGCSSLESILNTTDVAETNEGQTHSYSLTKIEPPQVSIFEKIDYYLGPIPKRVPASEYKPNSRAKLPRIDSASEGFTKLPEHVQEKILEREHIESEIRKAAASLIRDEDKVPLKHHLLVKWRFKAANYLISNNPEWPASLIKKMVGISSDEYYYYTNNASNLDPYEIIRPSIRECFVLYGKSQKGYRPMTALLRQHYGIFLSQHVVRRLMKEENLVVPSKKRNKRPYSSYVRGLPDIFPNLLNRDFSSVVFGQKVVTDISEFVVNGAKVYLSLYMDLATKMILSATISRSPSVSMVVDGLKRVLNIIPKETQIILHSDQGHHYKRASFLLTALNSGRIYLSNSRKGNCYDNGECEGRFSIMKQEMFHGRKFSSVNDFVKHAFNYCAWHNMYRIQIGLDSKTPMETMAILEKQRKENQQGNNAGHTHV